MQRLVKVFASLWLTIPTLLLLVAVLIAGTKWGTDVTNGALRKDMYRSVPFNVLLFVLAANLITCTLVRKPWKIWMWGFLTTHTGILTIMTGGFLSFNFKIYGTMAIPEGKSRDFIELEDERELHILPDEGEKSVFTIDYNLYRAEAPGERFPLRGTGATVIVEKYVPNVEDAAHYENTGKEPRPVVKVAIFLDDAAGPSFFFEDTQGVSNLGGLKTLMFHTLSDEGADNLAAAVGEATILRITLDGQSLDLDPRTQLEKPVMIGKNRVTIKAYDEGGLGGLPALIFEVHDGKETREYGCASMVPEQSPMDRETGKKAGFEARLIPAILEPSIRVMRTPKGLRYLMTNRKGEKLSGPVVVGEKIRYPFMPRKLEFAVVQFLDRGEPSVKPIEPKESVPLNPAVFVRLREGSEETSGWVRFHDVRAFSLGGQRIRVGYAPKRYYELDMVVSLKKFKKPTYQGSDAAALFESDLIVKDTQTGHIIEGTTGVNYPFVNRRWVFYQASYVEGPPPVTVLQVSRDPGKKVVYLGAIITISGTIWLFYMKGFLLSLYGLMLRGDPETPLGAGISTFYFVLSCLGTPIGLLLFATTNWIGLAVAGVMVGADLVGMGLTCSVASRLKPAKPGRGWQIANLAACGWIVNTAALVLILILRGT